MMKKMIAKKFDKLKIAIVDDEDVVSELMKEYILQNYKNIKQIDTFTCGFVFLKQKINYDVVFLDCQMPTISGEDVFKQIKNKELVVFMSGFPKEKINKNKLFLNKPFDFNELDKMIILFGGEKND